MRLAWKITLWLWAAIAVVLTVNAVNRYRWEAALFERDMKRDHEVLGRGLASAVAEVWEEEGRESGLDLVERANLREGQLLIRWVGGEGEADGQRAPIAPRAALEPVAYGRVATWEDERGEGRLYSYVPLLVHGRWTGALELSESTAAKRAYLRASMLRVGLTTGALAALAGAIAIAVGVLVVGRPVRALTDKARRVGAGDFGGDLALSSTDELGVLADEMNAMSRRLAEARRELEAEAASRVRAVEQLRHAERITTVGKLAAGVAHELGTPLNVIAWRVRNVATGKVEGEAARDNARVALEQVDRITRIVRQLLDYARGRAPDVREADLVEVAASSLALLEPAIRKAGVTARVVAPGPVVGRFDPGQLQQVLTNLVLNAAQAAPGGVVEVAVDVVEASPPEVLGLARGRWLRATVRDDGAGIAPEHLPHVFDPFFTTKEVGEGTGLGLAVAWGIAREHGGWISVESEPGRGASFAVHLPAEQP